MIQKKIDNVIPIKEMFKFIDLYFDRKGVLIQHLSNSYNKFIQDDVKLYLETGDHSFYDRISKDKIIKYKFVYDDISIKTPILDKDNEPMFPSHARDRNLTYNCKLMAKVTQIREIIDVNTNEITTNIVGNPEFNVPIAILPVMVGSDFCSLIRYKNQDKTESKYDPGGYFIVKGSEKVVIPQDKMCENKSLVFIKKESGIESYYVNVNSKSYNLHTNSQILSIRLKKDGNFLLRVQILNEVSIFILLRALGIESDKDIINAIVFGNKDFEMIDLITKGLEYCVDKNNVKIQTKQDAVNYLITKLKVIKKYSEFDKDIKNQQKKNHLLDLLKNNLLPHIEGGYEKKALYIGYMMNRLLSVYLKREKIDDRDSYINKRIDLPGDLLFELFKHQFKKMLSECNRFYKQRNPNDVNELVIINQIKPNIIEQGINSALSTGLWSRRKGVAQVLMRASFLYTISLLRRIDTPSGDSATGTLTGPRQLHPSSIRGCCPIQTPEHAKVGLTKHLSLLGNITIFYIEQVKIIKEFLNNKMINLDDIPTKKIKNYTKIFLNGEWLGLTLEPTSLFLLVKKYKLDGSFNPTISIIHNIIRKEIKIYCDGGRLFCPAIIVENNVPKLTIDLINETSTNIKDKNDKITSWDEFIIKNPGIIENIDVEEQLYCMLAEDSYEVEKMRKTMIDSIDKVTNDTKIENRYDDRLFVRFSHCELHPSLLIGEIVTNIPFCNHNPGTRNIFQYNQGRQAMGFYISNYRNRLDISYILYHSQKRLVSTRTSKYVYSDIMSAGENVIVAVMCYTGYNQEDSLIMNQAAIDRGLFRSTSLKKEIKQIQKNQSSSHDDIFTKPDPTIVADMKHNNYDKLNNKGYVPEETEIVNGDIIIGMITPIQATAFSNKLFRDNSLAYKSLVPAMIDKVYTNIFNSEGYEMRKIRTRSERTPVIGDKFCCYAEDHDILTINGWVPINKITMEHKIAYLYNKKYLKYGKPLAVQEYDHDGDIYIVESKQVSLKVTMNHRMYVSLNARDGNTALNNYKIEFAQDIYGKERKYLKTIKDYVPVHSYKIKELCYNYINNGKEYHSMFPRYFIIGEKENILKLPILPWLTFFGIWISQGYISSTINKVSIHVAAHKLCVKLALIDCCDELEFKITKDGDIKNELEQCCQDLNFDIYKKNSLILEKKDIEIVFDKCREYLKIHNGNVREGIIKASEKDNSNIKLYLQECCRELDYEIYDYSEKTILEKCCNFYGFDIFKQKKLINNTDIKDILETTCQTLNIDYKIINEANNLCNTFANKIINCDTISRIKITGILKNICKDYGYEINEIFNDYKKRNIWVLHDKLLTNFLDSSSVKSVNKFLPKWVWYLSTQQCRTLIEGMLLDSHKKHECRVYDTLSVEMADDFQRLCLHAGYSSNKTIKNKISNGTIIGYRIYINETENYPLVNKDGTNQVDRIEQFKGKVYCCTAPEGEGIVYIRRGGMPIWSGQSSMGCKGVIGLTMKRSDMPFTKNGIIPDIILNPCAWPSRMSVGQIIEILVGKRGVLSGTEIDGTAFNKIDIESEKDELEKLGYNRQGYEYLYNGETGQKLKAMICIGPNYYQRLKHLVQDKIHSRSGGTVTILTRQPPEGRARGGGLRLGEMERDCFLAHGLALFLKEKLVDTSDIYKTYVCGKCGLFAQRLLKKNNKHYTSQNDIWFCPACKNYTDVAKIIIPYAFKLLIQELMSMNIAPRIRVKKELFDY
jgi:DNA-directed RNA polymerase II subunit RPB2